MSKLINKVRVRRRRIGEKKFEELEIESAEQVAPDEFVIKLEKPLAAGKEVLTLTFSQPVTEGKKEGEG